MSNNANNNPVTRWREFSRGAAASAARVNEGSFAETNARQFARSAREAMSEARATMTEGQFWEAAAEMGAAEAGRFFAAWRAA